MCVRRFSAEGAVGSNRWMTGDHHALQEADTHRRETLDFVLSVQSLKTNKHSQQRDQPHIFRVPINSLRHRIDYRVKGVGSIRNSWTWRTHLELFSLAQSVR